jgi:voltage-gated potassium channel
MLKLTRHSPVFSLLWAVFRQEAPSIGALLFILCLTLTVSGALAYMIEGDELPAAMWWAIEILTTVGYGDMVPATAAGKLLGGLVSIVGVGTPALFSGVITVGFLEQLKTSREQRATVWGVASATAQAPAAAISRETCPHCGHQLTLDLIEPGKT